MGVAIIGHGAIGAYGSTQTQLREALVQERGRAGEGLAGRGPYLAESKVVEDYLPASALRRTDHFTRLALAAAMLALADARISKEGLPDCGLILTTGYGPVASSCAFKDSYLEHGPLGASPLVFTRSVQSQAAAHLAMQLDFRGPAITLCQHHFPFQSGLQLAQCWLATGKVAKVLVGGVDEFPPFLDYCRDRLLAEKGRERGLLADPLVRPGEGAAFFLLQGEEGPESQLARLQLVACSQPAKQSSAAAESEDDSAQQLGKTLQTVAGHSPTFAAQQLAALLVVGDPGEHHLRENSPYGTQAVIRVDLPGKREATP